MFHQNNIEIQEEVLAIEKAKKNTAEFEILYNKYFDRIYIFIYHRTADKDLSGDLTQQVFLKALYNIKDYKFKGLPFSAWLYRIALNEINQFFRKSKKTQTFSVDEKHFANVVESVEEENSDEKYQILIVSLSKLPKESVNLIQLRFFEDYSFKEIGDILGITENNAKVKIYRVLDKLKNFIRKGTKK